MIDYSAFDENKKNLGQYNGKLPGLPKQSSPIVALFIVSAFLLFFVIPFLLGSLFSPFSLFVIIGTIFFAYKLTWNGRESTIRTALFASRNKFGYSWKGGKYNKLKGMGSILGEPMKSNVVTGHFMGQSFTISGIYGGKHMRNVMRVTLPNKYPHIVLDTKENNKLISNLYTFFPDNKEFILEGDFPKYFRVFSATSPVETLQILSPELMARMIDFAHRADIEILDDQLLLICNFKFVDKEIYQMLFTAVEQILKDIGVEANNSKVKFNSESRI